MCRDGLKKVADNVLNCKKKRKAPNFRGFPSIISACLGLL